MFQIEEKVAESPIEFRERILDAQPFFFVDFNKT